MSFCACKVAINVIAGPRDIDCVLDTSRIRQPCEDHRRQATPGLATAISRFSPLSRHLRILRFRRFTACRQSSRTCCSFCRMWGRPRGQVAATLRRDADAWVSFQDQVRSCEQSPLISLIFRLWLNFCGGARKLFATTSFVRRSSRPEPQF